MKKMLTELGYRDVTLVDDLISGFCLVGQTPEAAALPSTFQPALLSEDDLLHDCRAANLAILDSTRSSGDLELDSELWNKSREEVAKGWLAKVDDLQVALDNGRISKRFPLRQGGKVRCIDNSPRAKSMTQSPSLRKSQWMDPILLLQPQLRRSKL